MEVNEFVQVNTALYYKSVHNCDFCTSIGILITMGYSFLTTNLQKHHYFHCHYCISDL